MRVAPLVSASMLLMGCYRYQPSAAAETSAGEYLRVELTDAGSLRLSPTMGMGVTNVEGTVTSASSQEMTLALSTVSRRGAASTTWTGDPLTLNSTDIRNVRRRLPARGRTIAALTGVTLGGVAIVIAIARATGLLSGGNGRPTPPPT